MFFLLIQSAFCLYVDTELDLKSYQYLGKFTGNNVTVGIKGKVSDEVGGKVKVEFGVVERKQEYFCGTGKVLFLGSDWSEEVRMELVEERTYYFYLTQCEGSGARVSVKLNVQDSENKHYSAQYEYFFYGVGLIVVLQLVLIMSSIFGIYKEVYEEVPLALTFIISLLYVICLMFYFLYAWIYSIEGTSYRFILIFSKMFEIFARVSLLGILFLISANRFNPTDFSIEEHEFFVFLMMIGAEFLVEVIGIFRHEVLNHYEMWTGVEGWLVVGVRIMMVFFVNKKSFGKIGGRLKGFGKVDTVIKLFVGIPLVFIIGSWIGFEKGKATILFALEHLMVVLGLVYLQAKFLSINFGGVLPFKTHNF